MSARLRDRCSGRAWRWALVGLMPRSKPLFAALFPGLARPLFELDGCADLLAGHLLLVGASSGAAILIGVGAGIFVTRPAGAEFRGLVATIVAIGQTFPPVAVLAVAVPVIGFGFDPAFIALLLYGLLPIVETTMAGLDGVPVALREAARGLGMSEGAILRKLELPLAAPVIIAGIRTSVIINVGTATVASTVGRGRWACPSSSASTPPIPLTFSRARSRWRCWRSCSISPSAGC